MRFRRVYLAILAATCDRLLGLPIGILRLARTDFVCFLADAIDRRILLNML